MYDVKKIDIWKKETNNKDALTQFEHITIEELSLSVRSYNCLKRAGCATIGDIKRTMGEDGTGLRKIRALGNRSETEILLRIEEMEREFLSKPDVKQKPSGGNDSETTRMLVKPARNVWNEPIDNFRLSERSLTRLKACGVTRVKDLYATNPKQEPGWYAVRELFGKIAMR